MHLWVMFLLNKFYHSLFNEEIVSSLSLSKMIEFKNNTGRGLFVFPFYDKLCYGHTGEIGRAHV